jgi:hypothetical protein
MDSLHFGTYQVFGMLGLIAKFRAFVVIGLVYSCVSISTIPKRFAPIRAQVSGLTRSVTASALILYSLSTLAKTVSYSSESLILYSEFTFLSISMSSADFFRGLNNMNLLDMVSLYQKFSLRKKILDLFIVRWYHFESNLILKN